MVKKIILLYLPFLFMLVGCAETIKALSQVKLYNDGDAYFCVAMSESGGSFGTGEGQDEITAQIEARNDCQISSVRRETCFVKSYNCNYLTRSQINDVQRDMDLSVINSKLRRYEWERRNQHRQKKLPPRY